MLIWVAISLLGLYGFALVAVAVLQERLFFFPQPLPKSHRFELAGVVERTIEVPGATLSALHLRQTGARGERQLHADVLAAYRSVASEYADRPVVLYGRSLGTGLAAKLATDVESPLLVLVSPYTSARDVGRELYPWVPPFVARYPLPTIEWLPRVTAKVLLLHGDRDAVIPLSHSRRLKAIRPDAELVVVEGATHEDIHSFPRFIDALTSNLDALDSGALRAP